MAGPSDMALVLVTRMEKEKSIKAKGIDEEKTLHQSNQRSPFSLHTHQSHSFEVIIIQGTMRRLRNHFI